MTEQSADEVRAELMHRVRTEGVVTAYETAINICRDPKAPSPAKATALTALFRVAGYLDKSDDRGDAKPLHEMSAEELAAALKRARRHMQTAPADSDDRADGEGAEAGVFG